MCVHSSIVCLFLLLGLSQESLAKCSEQTGCSACTVYKCSWCLTSNKCLDSWDAFAFCQSAIKLVTDSYDCPLPPKNGYEYDENFAKNKAFPLTCAAYSDQPQACLTNTLGSAQLKRQLNVSCDVAQTDSCSGFTAVSTSDRAIIASFRGTSGNIQLFLEGAESYFKNRKAFIGGGYVDAYFYDAFYSLWNAGMRDDLLTLKAAHPSYELWVTGHSLGGAMASLCAALAIKLNMWPSTHVKLVTFGQPRTGDEDFAKAHDTLVRLKICKMMLEGVVQKQRHACGWGRMFVCYQKVDYSYRVVHAHDLVPHIPIKICNTFIDSPYHHHYEVWYNNAMTTGSSYQLCTRADDDTCSNDQPHTSIDDHLRYFDRHISSYGNAGCR